MDKSYAVSRTVIERLVVTCPMEQARATDDHHQALGYRWIRSGSQRTGPGTANPRVYQAVLERELEPTRAEAPWNELFALARTRPLLYAALTAYQAGQMSWEEMLMVALKATTRELDSAQAAFEAHMQTCITPVRLVASWKEPE